MSTVTIVKKDGKIAIAADTLVKWSTEKNSAKYVVNHNKILKVGHNYKLQKINYKHKLMLKKKIYNYCKKISKS